jgi:hypothetical protein
MLGEFLMGKGKKITQRRGDDEVARRRVKGDERKEREDGSTKILRRRAR